MKKIFSTSLSLLLCSFFPQKLYSASHKCNIPSYKIRPLSFFLAKKKGIKQPMVHAFENLPFNIRNKLYGPHDENKKSCYVALFYSDYLENETFQDKSLIKNDFIDQEKIPSDFFLQGGIPNITSIENLQTLETFDIKFSKIYRMVETYFSVDYLMEIHEVICLLKAQENFFVVDLSDCYEKEETDKEIRDIDKALKDFSKLVPILIQAIDEKSLGDTDQEKAETIRILELYKINPKDEQGNTLPLEGLKAINEQLHKEHEILKLRKELLLIKRDFLFTNDNFLEKDSIHNILKEELFLFFTDVEKSFHYFKDVSQAIFDFLKHEVNHLRDYSSKKITKYSTVKEEDHVPFTFKVSKILGENVLLGDISSKHLKQKTITEDLSLAQSLHQSCLFIELEIAPQFKNYLDFFNTCTYRLMSQDFLSFSDIDKKVIKYYHKD